MSESNSQLSASILPNKQDPARMANVDVRQTTFNNYATVVLSNLLRVAYEPNADDNPIPTHGLACYMNGEKLPPTLTGLFDGATGYGAQADAVQMAYQREIALNTLNAIVNWFTAHVNTPKSRQATLNNLIRCFTIGQKVSMELPELEEEELDDYVKRVLSRVKQAPESESDTESEQKIVVQRGEKKKTSLPDKKAKPSKSTKTPAKKGAKAEISEDSESIADLKDDSDDSEIIVSESEPEISEESEVPTKVTKPAPVVGKKKFVRR